MNSLYQQLNSQPNNLSLSKNNLNNVKQLINMFKGSSNPQALLNNLAQSNPQVQNIYSLLQNGKNPRQLFYEMAKKKNINPDSILQLFQ